MSSPLKLSNNGIGTLAGNVSNVATSINLAPGEGAKFPVLAVGEFFNATIVRSSDNAYEVVKVTARSSDTLTVVRAQETTSAIAFLAGDRIELRMTAGTFTDEVARVEGKIDVLGTAANANVTTSATDTTAGRVLRVGDGGVLGAGINITDADAALTPGVLYTLATPHTNSPVTGDWCSIQFHALNGVGTIYGQQVAQYTGGTQANRTFIRHRSLDVWSPWVEFIHTGNAATLIPPVMDSRYPTIQDVKWLSKGIGEFYMVDDSIHGVDIPPTNSPLFRYIKLTAGLTGPGGYNNGCLTSESVTGTAPLLQATAVVSLAGSPMDGQTIDLLNTERRILRPGTSAGTKLQDTFQGHVFGLDTTLTLKKTDLNLIGGSVSGVRPIEFGTLLSPQNNGIDGTPRSSNETRMKSLDVTVYQRIF